MKERNFIAQNKNKWQELEDLLKEKRKDADRLSKLFTEVSEDLSYSRTFYRNRYVSVYLNGLTQQLFYFIYKNKRVGKSRFVFFWKEELPRLIYAARKELLFSLIVFAIAFFIGVVSTMYSSEFASAILGKDYVEQTIKNIKSGDPMAIYKESHQFNMFLQISFNNLYVSFLAFVTGLFFGIGSFGVLLYNGIMLGVFQYFFYKHGLFFTSAVTVWLHGTLEISSIIIASAAGITMGKGLIFPGTYERTQAFLISARRGVKILLGILPIIVLAAIIESFLTRYTETPVVIKLGLILASLSFIVAYFIVYPYRKNKSVARVPISEIVLQESNESTYDISLAQSNGMIFSRSFLIYKKNIGRIIKFTILLAILATGLNYIHFKNSPSYSSIFYYINSVFNYNDNIYSFAVNTFLFSICVFYSLQLTNTTTKPWIRNVINFFKIFLWVGVANLAFIANAVFTVIIFLITTPFLFQWLMVSQLMRQDLFTALFSGGSLVGESPGKAYGFFLIAAFTGSIYFLLIDTPIVGFLIQILNWNISLESETMRTLGKLIRLFMPYFSLFLVLPIMIIGHQLLFYSLEEIGTARGIAERVEKFKTWR